MEKKSLINLCLDLIELDPEKDSALIDTHIQSLSTKVESYCFVDDFADSQIEMLKKEMDFLERQVKAYKRVKDRLRSQAEYSMNSLGVKKIQGDNGHSIAFRRHHGVRVNNVDLLPAWAVDLVVEKRPNRTKIKDALQSGEEVPGADLVTNESVVFK